MKAPQVRRVLLQKVIKKPGYILGAGYNSAWQKAVSILVEQKKIRQIKNRLYPINN
jgi:hypothetical protein